MPDCERLNKPRELYSSRRTFRLIQTSKDNVGFYTPRSAVEALTHYRRRQPSMLLHVMWNPVERSSLGNVFFNAAEAHAFERKQMYVTRRARNEVESAANLDSQSYTIAQVLTLTFCLPLAKRPRAFCLT